MDVHFERKDIFERKRSQRLEVGKCPGTAIPQNSLSFVTIPVNPGDFHRREHISWFEKTSFFFINVAAVDLTR